MIIFSANELEPDLISIVANWLKIVTLFQFN